ncbi:MAG: sel1 repeat family protein, partial [Planctomycetaceae bacterium]|nr:sel1 repeat family protein [Planctomycetaceae bacterium]
LLRAAADGGLALAQHNLGQALLQGNGVAQDPSEAARWFTRAAEQGLAVAQERLGALHEHGRGVAQDDVLASAWYSLALSNGQRSAGERLAALERRLAPDQRERARQLVPTLVPVRR